MRDQPWDSFIIYVNAYYAVQEAYDSARRNWERPAEGLDAFCRDANPFLWDTHASAEEGLYEEFLERFRARFVNAESTGRDGYAFAREWLGGLEGDAYGTSLVASFDAITDEDAFAKACEPIARQLQARAMRLERTPQDEPEFVPEPVKKAPTSADIDAVIALLSKGDDAFAQSLRERLAADGADS